MTFGIIEFVFFGHDRLNRLNNKIVTFDGTESYSHAFCYATRAIGLIKPHSFIAYVIHLISTILLRLVEELQFDFQLESLMVS